MGRTTWRRVAPATAGGAMALVVLMALAPAGLGSHARTTLLPPYAGTTSQPQQSTYASCGTVSGKATHWSATSGTVTGASKSTFKNCNPWVGVEQAAGTFWDVVTIPFHVSHNSVTNVSVSMTYKVTGAMSVTGGTVCPAAVNYSSGYDYVDCYWEAGWEAYAYISLFDLTNHTYVSYVGGSYGVSNVSESFIENYCYYGNCSTYSAAGSPSSSSDYYYDTPQYNYGWSYIPTGTSAGAVTLWANSSNYWPVYSSGSNLTLLTTHKYVLIETMEYYSFAQAFGDNYAYDGTNYNYYGMNLYGGSGSASVSGSGTTGGWKTTSVTVTAA